MMLFNLRLWDQWISVSNWNSFSGYVKWREAAKPGLAIQVASASKAKKI